MLEKIICVVSLLSIFMTGCAQVEFYEDNNNENLYSRSQTEFMVSSNTFGTFKSDDIYVALDNIYNSEEIKKTHGEDFNVSEEDVVCHKSETQTKFFKSCIKGEAEYSIKIDYAVYRVKLTKEYNGKWKVVSCESENR